MSGLDGSDHREVGLLPVDHEQQVRLPATQFVPDQEGRPVPPQSSHEAEDQSATRGIPDAAMVAIGMPIVVWATLAMLGFALMVFIFGRSLAAIAYIYGRSWYVIFWRGSDPCDVPVAKVVLGSLLLVPIFLLRRFIQRLVCRICCIRPADDNFEPMSWRKRLVFWTCLLLAYFLAFAGIDSTKQARACHSRARDLYSWAAYMFPVGAINFFGLHILAASLGVGLVLHTLTIRWGGRNQQSSSSTEPTTVARLETVVIETSGDRQCSVCLEGFVPGREATFMPCCRNLFHPQCIQDWLRSHQSCPLCRARVQDSQGPAANSVV